MQNRALAWEKNRHYRYERQVMIYGIHAQHHARDLTVFSQLMVDFVAMWKRQIFLRHWSHSQPNRKTNAANTVGGFAVAATLFRAKGRTGTDFVRSPAITGHGFAWKRKKKTFLSVRRAISFSLSLILLGGPSRSLIAAGDSQFLAARSTAARTYLNMKYLIYDYYLRAQIKKSTYKIKYFIIVPKS